MSVYNWKLSRNINYLSVFLIILSLSFSSYSLFLYGGSVKLYAILLNNVAPLFFLIGPFLYFYVRSINNNDYTLKLKDSLHFIPFLINLVAIIPYLFTSFEYKLQIAKHLMQNYYGYRDFDFMLFYPHYLNNIGRAFSLLAYSLYSFYIIYKHIKSNNAISHLHYSYKFISVILCLVIIISLGHLLTGYLYTVEDNLEVNKTLFTVTINTLMIFYSVIPIYILFNPRTVYGYYRFIGLNETLRNQPHTSTFEELRQEEVLINNKTSKTKSTPYDNSLLYRISEEVLKYLNSDQKPFLKPDFSIHDISINLNIPKHQIHACFSHVIKQDFREIKNKFRIEYALELLEKKEARNVSMEGIGQQAGFASNSNFYTCFKEVTGLTPNQWLKQNKMNTISKE